MLKIGFLTTLGVNIGDEFIREGIRAVLDGMRISYSVLYINKHDRKSLFEAREDESEIVKDKYWESDVFIQSGAPVYWHLHGGQHTSLTSEWHQWMWRERILSERWERRPLFVNLGAGSCGPWGEQGDTFLADVSCREFAIAAGRRANLTAVRDPVASRILRQLGVSHQEMVCPAFLAGARHRAGEPRRGVIGVNLMPLGSHWDLANNFNQDQWRERCRELCAGLRRVGKLVFICHDQTEREFAGVFADGGERTFLGSGWRDYFDMYSSCDCVVANRVHGAVCAAGFGVPSVIMGNDTRAEIGRYIGLPIFCSAQVKTEEVLETVSERMRRRREISGELLERRDQAIGVYQEWLRPLIAQTEQDGVTEKVVSKPTGPMSLLRRMWG